MLVTAAVLVMPLGPPIVAAAGLTTLVVFSLVNLAFLRLRHGGRRIRRPAAGGSALGALATGSAVALMLFLPLIASQVTVPMRH